MEHHRYLLQGALRDGPPDVAHFVSTGQGGPHGTRDYRVVTVGSDDSERSFRIRNGPARPSAADRTRPPGPGRARAVGAGGARDDMSDDDETLETETRIRQMRPN
jgi:hypothetical protein